MKKTTILFFVLISVIVGLLGMTAAVSAQSKSDYYDKIQLAQTELNQSLKAGNKAKSEKALKELHSIVNDTMLYLASTGDFDGELRSIVTNADIDYLIADAERGSEGVNMLTDYDNQMLTNPYLEESEKYNGQLTLHCENKAGDSSTYIDLIRWKDLPVKPNTYYTLSFWAKGSGEIHSFLYPQAVKSGKSNKGETTIYEDGNIMSVLNSDWTQYVITYQTKSEINDLKNIIPARLWNGFEVSISNIKLEENSIVTK